MMLLWRQLLKGTETTNAFETLISNANIYIRPVTTGSRCGNIHQTAFTDILESG